MPVVIVGAGPTGITAATLLAQYGIECLVLDRWSTVYPQPRAVHLDDEIFRIVARLGIAEEFAAISRPAQGLRLLDPTMRVLAEFRRDTALSPDPPMGRRCDVDFDCAPWGSVVAWGGRG
jgi:3-(3-hydroxy-phenyl)propionate hydroxylase